MALNLTREVEAALKEYLLTVNEDVDEALQSVAKETAQQLRAVSPKRAKGKGAKYASGWTTKTVGKYKEVVVYNKNAPQLTHLLENGHVKANQYGEYGRTEGIKHIAPVEQWANEEAVRRVEEALNK